MSRFVAQIEGATAMSRTDINKVAETILIPLLAEVYGYTNLKNLNYTEDSNYPGIDLGDETARVAFQVTSTSDSDKVKHTLIQFVENKFYEKYDKLIIYILKKKQKSYSGSGYEKIIQGNFTFDKDKDIWDYRDILKEVANFQSVDKARQVERILEDNFAEGRTLIEWEVVDNVERIVSEYSQLFVGREEESKKLDEFLSENSSGVMLVTAGAGFGKTALLANWVNAWRDKDYFIAYHFFTQRYGAVRSAYRNLLRQLYIYYKPTYQQILNDDEEHLKIRLYNLLREYGTREGKPLIIVIDGLDEAEKTFSPPFHTPLLENVFVIASARAEKAEEHKYLENWTDNSQQLNLNRLSCGAIAQWLRNTDELAAFAEDTHFVTQLDEITQGFPLYLRYLTEELIQAQQKGEDVQVVLTRSPKGFSAYVQEQFQRLAQVEEIRRHREVQELFALLSVALGALSEDDIQELTDLNEWDLAALPWQATRWFSIQTGFYSFAHPLLAQEFQGVLKRQASSAKDKLIKYCSRWQEHQRRYALRHYAEHLSEAKQWEELYAIARRKDFASAQQQQLPDEPDLPLKTVQTALLGAAEEDKAERMAEFLLVHAHRLGQTNAQESPLEALRSGSLNRAWKLADQFEIERCILWYLLLTWELKDEGKLDDAREILEKLRQKDLPRFQINGDIRWQGDYAAYLLAYVFDINKNTSTVLVQQLLENDHCRLVCTTLSEHGDFNDALDTAQVISSELDRVWELERIGKGQAAKGQKDAARSTFTKALEIIHKAAPHILWVHEIVRIAEAQLEELEDLEAARNTLENAFEKAQNIFTIARENGREIEDQEKQKDTLLEIARIEAEVNELINDTLESTETNKNQKRNTKDNSNPRIKQNNPLAIAYAHAKVENFSVMLEIMEKIEGLVPIEALASIANALAEEGLTKTARTTFATALQIPQGSEAEFLQALALSDVAVLQVASKQKEAGTNTINIAHQIAQKINNPTKQVIALALRAKVLANTGKRKEAKAIFDNLLEIAQNIKIQKERVNSFTFIAKTQIRIKEFTSAFRTAQKIESPWIKAKVLGMTAKAEVEAGLEKESQATLCAAFGSAEGLFPHMEWLWVDVMCDKAMAQAVKHKEAALATFRELLEFAQESGKQRDSYLSKIAAAQAQAGEISYALETTDEIEDELQLVQALSWIALAQFKKGKKQELSKTLTAALQAKDKIQDKQKLMRSLKAIARIQAMAGKGEEAVRTAETILTERNLHLPGVASCLVETGDQANFKRLLIPCAYYLDAAYDMCGYLAQLYPEKAEDIAKVVSELN